jgi:hypothetical protein
MYKYGLAILVHGAGKKTEQVYHRIVGYTYTCISKHND